MKTITDLTLDDEFLSNRPKPEKDNLFDECIEGVKYGGNGRPWGSIAESFWQEWGLARGELLWLAQRVKPPNALD